MVGAAIIELLRDLQAKLGVSYVFITHDIAKVRAISDDIVVLYAGRRVETGSRDALCAPPYHPYSHLLVSSAPELRAGWLDDATERCHRPLVPIGERENEAELCPFLSRCAMRVDGVCNRTARRCARSATARRCSAIAARRISRASRRSRSRCRQAARRCSRSGCNARRRSFIAPLAPAIDVAHSVLRQAGKTAMTRVARANTRQLRF